VLEPPPEPPEPVLPPAPGFVQAPLLQLAVQLQVPADGSLQDPLALVPLMLPLQVPDPSPKEMLPPLTEPV